MSFKLRSLMLLVLRVAELTEIKYLVASKSSESVVLRLYLSGFLCDLRAHEA